MRAKITFLIFTAVFVTGWLAFSAAQSTAKSVLTVPEITALNLPIRNIRLGAQVSAVSEPTGGESSFFVVDPQNREKPLEVVYRGALPEMLQPGRGAIIEGDFDGTRVAAKSIMTQCPSKYEPPEGQAHVNR